LYILGRGSERKKNTLIYNKVVSEAACRDRQRKTECWRCSVVIVAGRQQSKEPVRRTVKEGWKHSGLLSDNRFSGGQIEQGRMATEGHACGGKKNHQQ
jgi:hypothetical protein